MYDWIDEKTASELRKGTKGNTALQSWRKGLGTSSTPILFAAASPGLWGRRGEQLGGDIPSTSSEGSCEGFWVRGNLLFVFFPTEAEVGMVGNLRMRVINIE